MKSYVELFKNSLFLRYFFSINLITLAQSFINISIVWLIYTETKNPFLIAIFGILTQVPSIIFGPLCSKILDRYNIGRAMSILLVIKSSIFIIIFILPFNEIISLYSIAFLLSINSVISLPLSAGGDIIIKEVCREDFLVTANSLMIIFFDISYIFGSISVAVLDFLEKRYAFMIGAILFSISALLLWSLKTEEVFLHTKKKENNYSIIKVLNYLIKDEKMRNMILNTNLWNMFCWGGISILLPIYVDNTFGNSSSLYGILNSLQSVGIIVGSLAVGVLVFKKVEIKKLIYYGIIIHCFLLIIFYNINKLSISIMILIISGIASAPVLVYKSTFYQKNISREIMGRAFSLILVFGTVMYSLGGVIVAYLLNLFGENNFAVVNELLLSITIISVIVTLIRSGRGKNK